MQSFVHIPLRIRFFFARSGPSVKSPLRVRDQVLFQCFASINGCSSALHRSGVPPLLCIGKAMIQCFAFINGCSNDLRLLTVVPVWRAIGEGRGSGLERSEDLGARGCVTRCPFAETSMLREEADVVRSWAHYTDSRRTSSNWASEADQPCVSNAFL